MSDVIGPHHRHTARIKSCGQTLIPAGVLSQAMDQQHAGFGVFNRPVSVLDATRETVHVMMLLLHKARRMWRRPLKAEQLSGFTDAPYSRHGRTANDSRPVLYCPQSSLFIVSTDRLVTAVRWARHREAQSATGANHSA